MADDDLAAKIEEIRQMFLQRVRDEWLGRVIALRTRAVDDWSRQTMEEMIFLSHTLAGSAATFGFMTLSDAARQLEIAAKKIQQSDGAASEDGKSAIAPGLERLQTEAQAALDDLRT